MISFIDVNDGRKGQRDKRDNGTAPLTLSFPSLKEGEGTEGTKYIMSFPFVPSSFEVVCHGMV